MYKARCHRAGYRSTARAKALNFGSVWANRLEGDWATVEQTHLTDLFEETKLNALHLAYRERWKDYNAAFTRGTPEVEFRIPLINPDTGKASRTFDLAGKMDLVLESIGDLVYPLESKTTSDDAGPGSAYQVSLSNNCQLGIYFEACDRLYGQRFSNQYIYDITKKPGIEPLLATPVEKRRYTKEGVLYAKQRDCDESLYDYRNRVLEYVSENLTTTFQRPVVVRTEEERKRDMRNVWAMAQMVSVSIKEKLWPRNTSSCYRMKTLCEFFQHCVNGISLRDPLYFEQGPEHRELKEVV